MASRRKKQGKKNDRFPEANAADLEDLFERIVNLLGTERRQIATERDVKDVQLRALDYLHSCNRFSDTPLALAEFLGLTKGTVSQTVNSLEAKDLLKKVPDEDDRRVVHLHLTKKGKDAALDSFPLPVLERAVEDIPQDRRHVLAESLREILAALQRATGNATFGVCHSCRHLKKEDQAYRCGLTDEPLLIAETKLICREHEHPEAACGSE